MKTVVSLSLLVIIMINLGGYRYQNPIDGNFQFVYKTYILNGEGFGGDFTITINGDGTYYYGEGSLSSYYGIGAWTLSDDTLCLTECNSIGYPLQNYFKLEDDELVYYAENSTNFMHVKLCDGARFTKWFEPIYTENEHSNH